MPKIRVLARDQIDRIEPVLQQTVRTFSYRTIVARLWNSGRVHLGRGITDATGSAYVKTIIDVLGNDTDWADSEEQARIGCSDRNKPTDGILIPVENCRTRSDHVIGIGNACYTRSRRAARIARRIGNVRIRTCEDSRIRI